MKKNPHIEQLSSFQIFDMEELKSHIGISMRGEAYDRERLLMLSICGLSFLEDKEDDLSTPCWLCIINLTALESLSSPEGKCAISVL
jgi:hypothetical protein